MLEIITAAASILTSGAGGGIAGGLFCLFKQSQERKERIELAKIKLEQYRHDSLNAEKEREHARYMLEASQGQELQLLKEDASAEIEVTRQASIGAAQSALTNLKTTKGMDNYRGSVRPTLAYLMTAFFISMLVWSFIEWHDLIDDETGKMLLIGLFQTLNFSFVGVQSFYFISRRNEPTK